MSGSPTAQMTWLKPVNGISSTRHLGLRLLIVLLTFVRCLVEERAGDDLDIVIRELHGT